MATRAVTQLEAVFRAHQACVLKAAFRVTGSMADAEDVSQSVFLRLARGTVDSDRISNLQGYLRRAAGNSPPDFNRARGPPEGGAMETAGNLQSNSTGSPETGFA